MLAVDGLKFLLKIPFYLISYSFTRAVSIRPPAVPQWRFQTRRCCQFVSLRPRHIHGTVPETIPSCPWKYLSSSPRPRLLLLLLFLPAPPSLKLGHLEGRGAGKVQEEGSFLFWQEGGGDDVVDACWDVFRLHVAEATSSHKEKL